MLKFCSKISLILHEFIHIVEIFVERATLKVRIFAFCDIVIRVSTFLEHSQLILSSILNIELSEARKSKL